MRAPTPMCRSIQPWIKGHLGKHCLAPLTGQDFRAFTAFVHLVDLYCCSDQAGREATLQAMRHVLDGMQPKCHILCKKAIPHVMDWGDEERIWSLLDGIRPLPARDI